MYNVVRYFAFCNNYMDLIINIFNLDCKLNIKYYTLYNTILINYRKYYYLFIKLNL